MFDEGAVTIKKPVLAGMLLVIAIAAFAVYANSLTNGFVYDDRAQILENALIRDFSNLATVFSTPASFANYYRPLMYLDYMCVYRFFGLNTLAFHLVNVLVHCANSILVFFVAQRVLTRRTPAHLPPWLYPPFVAALLFAVQPIHTEVVAWAACIPDLFVVLFGLAAFCLHAAANDREDGPFAARRLAALALFFLAALSKETALVIPAVILAYDFAFKRMQGNPAELAKRYLPYLAVAFLYFGIRVAAIGKGMPSQAVAATPFECLINVFPLVALYLEKLLLPIDLNALYNLPLAHSVNVAVLVGLVVTAALAFAVIKLPRRAPELFFALVVLLLPLLPVLYIPAITRTFAERYLYLPSVGFVLIAARLSVCAAARSRRAGAVATVVLLVTALYGAVTVRRNGVWHDDYALWSDTVAKSPEDAVAHDNLGNALVSLGRFDEAIQQYRSSLALPNNHAPERDHVGLGFALDREGRAAEAADEYRQALRFDPTSEAAHLNLALVLDKMKRGDEAMVEFQDAVRLKPDDPQAHAGLGMALSERGALPQAEEQLAEALRLDPANQGAHNALAIDLWKEGRHDEAIREFQTVVQLNPESASARNNLAYALGSR